MTTNSAPAAQTQTTPTAPHEDAPRTDSAPSAAANGAAPSLLQGQDVCDVEGKQAGPTLIERPVGETKTVDIQPGHEYLFGFTKTDAQSFSANGDDVTIKFDCGGVLILKGYHSAMSAGDPAKFAFSDIPSQGELSGLIKSAQADQDDAARKLQLAEEQRQAHHHHHHGHDAQHAQVNVANIEPAAGGDEAARKLANIQPAAGGEGGGANGGGYGFNSSFSAESINPLNDQGPIGATALQYNAEFPPQRVFFLSENSIPTLSVPLNAVDETKLSGGPINANGHISADFGNDGPGTIGPDNFFAPAGSLAGGSLTSHGVAVQVTQTADGYVGVAGGATVFTLDIDKNTGDYVFVLNAPLDHADASNPNDVIALIFAIRATDNNGDFTHGSLTITVADDAPAIAAPTSDTISEAGLVGGPVSVSDTLAINFGQDLPGHVHATGVSNASGDLAGGVLSSGGVPVTIAATANGYTGTAGGATVFTINIDPATGAYTFTLDKPLDNSNPGDHIDLNFGVAVTDYDGDTTTTDITIHVLDSVPHLPGNDNPTIGNGLENIDETNLGPITVGGALTVDSGADTPSAVTATGAFTAGGSLEAGALTSHGVPVTIVSSSSGYLGMAGGVTVFALSVNNAGQYVFTQYASLDHGNPNDPNDVITLTFGVKVTDFDGDSANGNIIINVADDAPSIASAGPITIGEQDLGTPAATANGVLTHDFGHDGAGAISTTGVSHASGSLAGGVLSSGGHPVTIAPTADGYVGTANGATVFTLTIDPTTGAYSFALLGALDHAGAGADIITLTFGAKITDYDGDSANGDIVIQVQDDVPHIPGNDHPTIGHGLEVVDETNLGPITVNGTLAVNIGHDAPGSVDPNGVFASGGSMLGGNLTSHGVAVQVTQTADGYVGAAGGQTVFSITIDHTTGAYSFTLDKPLDQANAADPDDVITLNFGVKATDSDGDTATGSIQINVHDDGPVAHDDAATVTSTATFNGNVLTNDHVGADMPGTVSVITFNGAPHAVVSGAATTVTGAYGVLRINADGSYDYAANLGAHGTDHFTYTMHDYDNDPSTANLDINVNVNGIVTVDNGANAVDETNMAPTTSVSDVIHATFQGDGPGTFAGTGTSVPSQVLTSHGQPVTIAFNAGTNTYTGTAGGATVFTLAIQADGHYTFTLDKPLDHPNAADPNDALGIDFGVKATGTDGVTANGVVHIAVLDDGPTAHDDGFTINHNLATINGNVLANDHVGVDMPGTVSAITFHGVTTAVNAGTATTIIGDFGTLHINADGAFDYTPKGGVDGADTFRYTMHDFDGDTSSANLSIAVTVDDKPVLANSAVTVDETDLNPATSASNVITADFGLDGPGGFAGNGGFTGGPFTSGGHPVTIAFDAGSDTYTGTSNGHTVFTLSIQTDGHYTFTLDGVLDHPNAADPNDALSMQFGVNAIDHDGDVASGTITVNVLDDAPVAHDDFNSFPSSQLTTAGNVITGDHGGPGAADILSHDLPNHVTDIAFGTTHVAVPTTGTATIEGQYGELKIAADGSYTYELHPGNVVPQQKDYNINLVLDVSGSMGSASDHTSKLYLLEQAVDHLLGDFHNYNGGVVKVNIIPFDDTAHAAGTFNVTTTAGLNSALAFVNGMSGGGNTDYEAPLQAADGWLHTTAGANAPTAGGADVTYFVTDGEPNYYINASGHVVAGTEQQSMNEILGSDGSNEVGDVQLLSQVIGVGINVGAKISNIDEIDSSGHAINVMNPSDLDAALQGSNPIVTLPQAGTDQFVYTITDGDGDPSHANLTIQSQQPPLTASLHVNADAHDVTVKEDSSVFVSVAAAATGDGHEQMTLTLTGIDPSWGFAGAGWTATGVAGEYKLTLGAGVETYNGGFTLSPPHNSDVDMNGLHVTANVTEAGLAPAAATADFNVLVDAVVDTPVLTVQNTPDLLWIINQTNPTPLNIQTHVTDNDGSETVVKVVLDLNGAFTNPVGQYDTLADSGITLNKGTETSHGVWTITVGAQDAAAALNGLSLLTPTDDDYYFSLHNGPHSGVITVSSYVAETNLSGGETDFTDNQTVVMQNITYNFSVSPLVIDMNNDGQFDIVAKSSGVKFDMTNDGIADHTSWVGAHDGLLALDANHNGAIDNQSELFGNSSKVTDGFANLGQYDANHDGMIDAKDSVFNQLIVWQDVNQDGVSQSGEMMSLTQLGITAIHLTPTDTTVTAAADGYIAGIGSIDYADGHHTGIADAYFNVQDATDTANLTLNGTSGNDVMYGDADRGTTFHANGGFDAIFGGAQNNVIVIDHMGPGNMVDVKDFHVGDVLDLSGILGHDPVQESINDFVFKTEVNGNTVISVDTTGHGDAAHATQVAVLEHATGLDLDQIIHHAQTAIAA